MKASSALVSAAVLAGTPSVAMAATATMYGLRAIPAAFAASSHYISYFVMGASSVAQRFIIKPNMTKEEETYLAKMDIAYLSGVTVIVISGLVRLTQTEKGWGFYQKEPVFWVKMLVVGIQAACSMFNTTIIIKRYLSRRAGKFEPMSEALAKRMVRMCDAELLAMATIPLPSSLMARGVFYGTDISWKTELALVTAVFARLSFKTVTDALTFEDKNPMTHKK